MPGSSFSLKRNANGALIRNAVTGALCSTCCYQPPLPPVKRRYICTYTYEDWENDVVLTPATVKSWNASVYSDPGYMADTLTPWTINGVPMSFDRRITYAGVFTITPLTQEMSNGAGGTIRVTYTPLTAVLRT